MTFQTSQLIVADTGSSMWYDTAISWDGHLARDWAKQKLVYFDGVKPENVASQFSWAPLLVNTWDAAWLRSVRVSSMHRDRLKTRIHSRLSSGYVQARWAESIERVKAERT